MDFSSDNTGAADSRIMDRLLASNQGTAAAYEQDANSRGLKGRFEDIFECPLEVFPVVTGSAANSLALAAMTPPYGSILCHRESHIQIDECGAPEFFTGGAKLTLLDGDHGKIEVDDLRTLLENTAWGFVHSVQPRVLSLTQSTEAGTVYTPEQIRGLSNLAKSFDLKVHMDGARFANAVAHLGCSPAELSWKAGVDILCFGATKNGALAAEAILIFRPELAEGFGFRRKRAGHLISKSRFLAVQLETYIENDLWLENARHANAMARRLADGFRATQSLSLMHPVDANELFVAMPDAVADGLEADGFKFIRNWQGEPAPHHRFVTAFNTEAPHVDQLVASVRRYDDVN